MKRPFKPSSYATPIDKKIREINTLFGKPKPNDQKPMPGSNIIYKGRRYRVTEVGIRIPTNTTQLQLFDQVIERIAKPIWGDAPTKNLEVYDPHHNIDDSPYDDCFSYLENLLADIKEKLRLYITDLEGETQSTGRLEKPNYLAFYRPFHFWPNSWGIYMNTQRLNNQALRIFNYNQSAMIIPSLTFEHAVKMSFFETYFHEMYHHKFEMLATKMELAIRRPVYREGFNRFYCETFGTDYCLEEAFANVYGLNKSVSYLKEKLGFTYPADAMKELIRVSILRTAPQGYRVAYEITAPADGQFEESFENRFIEILYDYTHQKLFGTTPPPVSDYMWEMFTYKLDPLINTDNTVTFIIPQD